MKIFILALGALIFSPNAFALNLGECEQFDSKNGDIELWATNGQSMSLYDEAAKTKDRFENIRPASASCAPAGFPVNPESRSYEATSKDGLASICVFVTDESEDLIYVTTSGSANVRIKDLRLSCD
jgi:hypothetical protein